MAEHPTPAPKSASLPPPAPCTSDTSAVSSCPSPKAATETADHGETTHANALPERGISPAASPAEERSAVAEHPTPAPESAPLRSSAPCTSDTPAASPCPLPKSRKRKADSTTSGSDVEQVSKKSARATRSSNRSSGKKMEDEVLRDLKRRIAEVEGPVVLIDGRRGKVRRVM
jgi:hypothetical protein